MTKSYKALITGASRGIGPAIADLFKHKNIEVIAPTRQEAPFKLKRKYLCFCEN